MYYFATFLFILLSANGTFVSFFNIDWFIIEFIFIWIGIEYDRFNKRDIRLFGKFALIYIGYCSFRSLFLVHLPLNYFVSDIIYLFKYILPSFLFCALLKDRALYYLSKVIIDLVIISIPFYLVQLVAGNALYNIGTSIGLPPYRDYDYTNFIVFVYTKAHTLQNCGFAWEPGAYGFFLNLGLVFHLMYNSFVMDKRAVWIIVAIITTLSTTSFIGLLVVMILFFRARGVKFSFLTILAVPVILIMVFELPFLADKIVQTYKHDLYSLQNIEYLSRYYLQTGESFALNRFASLLLIYKLFGAQLIFGVSNIFTETQPILKNINISNGIFEFCAKFGVIGLVFMLYRGYLFFRTFTVNFEQAFYCVILILILGFGESIFVLPIATALFFLHYYAQPEEIEEDDQHQFDEPELENGGQKRHSFLNKTII
ncbi:hypothetical protein [Mucilaginibacter sp. UR6-11]|uniref:hypothetical protein n=1 Tax=Mucilaginibacter sp. UR6-11 TaxID=1435644 RepID=UPI001E63B507|nr:hypothetical protein [Mucilaginibacter sp. UR6-11]MCC8426194.1 hypothetical protein [Mucilaginibacter sp. UR6-11]